MGVPVGWFVAGSSPADYEVVTEGAARTLRAKGSAPRGFGTLMQEFVPEGLRGRRVRLSGRLRSEGVTGRAGLWMRVDGPGRKMIVLDNMHDRPVTGTTPWTAHTVVLDVPEEAQLLAFGALLDSAGSLSVEGLALEVVGADVPVTATPRPLPRAPRNLDFGEGDAAPARDD